MKNRNVPLWLALSGLALLLFVALRSSTAAPKPTVPNRAQPKWEYCFVDGFAHDARTRTHGVQVHLPDGRVFMNEAETMNPSVSVQVLNRLGSQGWEIVGYANGSTSGYNRTWTLKRRK